MDRPDLRSLNTGAKAARTAKRLRRSGRRSPLVAIVGTAVAALGVLAVSSVGLPARDASADPATVLSLAGRVAADQPDLVPRADQYWYVAEAGGYQAWLSMDGTHDGLVISNGRRIPVPGCRGGIQSAADVGEPNVPCLVAPAYLADAPDDPAAMKRYLAKRLHGDSDPNRVGKELTSLLEFHYLRPGARAALFRAGGAIPGLQLHRGGSNGLSANQVAVGWTHAGGTASLVFDATTHGFIGITTAADSTVGMAAPTFGIVDHVEQLP